MLHRCQSIDRPVLTGGGESPAAPTANGSPNKQFTPTRHHGFQTRFHYRQGDGSYYNVIHQNICHDATLSGVDSSAQAKKHPIQGLADSNMSTQFHGLEYRNRPKNGYAGECALGGPPRGRSALHTVLDRIPATLYLWWNRSCGDRTDPPCRLYSAYPLRPLSPAPGVSAAAAGNSRHARGPARAPGPATVCSQ